MVVNGYESVVIVVVIYLMPSMVLNGVVVRHDSWSRIGPIEAISTAPTCR